jgi:hypothetical protein
MIGNEGCIPSGTVESSYAPQNKFAENKHQFWNVSNVRWITTLRHPYSRTLSQYHHVIGLKDFRNLTLEAFLTQVHLGGFSYFIPNQMTRWHCGTGSCIDHNNRLSPHELQHAMDNLAKMSAVLILEDFSDPSSCTRRQMRHVLKFKKLEVLDDSASNLTEEQPKPRNSKTKWEEAIRPYLDDTGSSTNLWALSSPAQVGNMSNSTAHVNSTTSHIMAALGVHNDYDLQLYGYAKHLCHVLADKYDKEEEEAAAAAAATLPPQQPWKDLIHMAFSTTTNSSETSSILANSTNSSASFSSLYHQENSSMLLIMYVVVILVLVSFSKQRKRKYNDSRTVHTGLSRVITIV